LLTADVGFALRVELRKLSNQLVPRLLLVASVLGPVLFTVLMRVAHATPGDTTLGAWVHSSGFAPPLVLLAFMASFAFPISAGLLAGDIFAAEDRQNTWKNVLTRAVDRRAVFIAKFLAASLYSFGLLVLAAISSVASGVLIVGSQPLVGLSGQLIGAAPAFGLTLAAWALNILPLIAFVALGVFFSVATRNGIAGAFGPIALALLMQLLQHIGNGGLGHQLLLLASFDSWHGIITKPLQGLPLLLAVFVSLVWTVVPLTLAWRLFSRREFSGGEPQRDLARWRVLGVTVSAVLGVTAVMVGLCFVGSDPVTPRQVEAALKPTFERLVFYQQELLGRPILPGAKLSDTDVCARRGLAQDGAGDDWVCTIEVLTPQDGTVTPNFEPVDYDVTVKVNGCWSADGPPSFIGNETFKARHGGSVYNPLFEIYGCFNPL
jgi:ABC-2 type transport system permease protein